MKKFLLSLFCCLMAFANIQAEEKTINVTFSEFTAGEQYAKNEEHKLSEELTIYTTQCHFTTELRIYSSSTHNGFVVSNKLPGTITQMTFNAGNETDNLVVYGSNDGKDWKEVGNISTTSSYKDYTLDFSNTSYTYFKLDVEGTKQIRLKSMSVTYTVENGDDSGETPENATATFTASTQGYANGVAVTNATFGDYITATFGSKTKYYDTGKAIRVYGGDNFTINSSAGNISKIALTFASGENNNTITTNVGTFDGNTWTGTAKSITFTVGGTSGHRRISAIEVTYSTNANEEEVENVNAPVISTESTEYIIGEEIAVEITSTTDGATIYYTLDGTDPTTDSNKYNEAFTISATTTVKAFAVKEGCVNSAIATKTFTFKNLITLENASVADVIEAYKPEENKIAEGATVIGYIVGTNGNLSNTTDVKSNLLLADSPEEDNLENCIAVELPDNKIRAALNLVNNPGNYKRKVILTGNVEQYFNKAGLKKVNSYDFVIEGEWATMFRPNAGTAPAGYEAYIVTGVKDGWATLKPITGIIPAETGVILKRNVNAVTEDSSDADVTGNLLMGSVASDTIAAEAYILSNVDNVIGFYKAEMNLNKDGKAAWLNNANKAYLPASAIAAAEGVSFYGFRFGDEDDETTAVDKVEVVTENVIFDLAGRRISEITAPGIYIIGGRKVLIK